MMIWDLEDGVHVGRLGVVLADGRIGERYEPGGVVVEGVTGHHHRHPERPSFEIVPEDSTVGWQASCEYGWAGDPWNRAGCHFRIVGTRREAKALLGSPAIPPIALEQSALGEWHRHALTWAVQMADRSLRRASSRLDQVVAKARTAGATWADIGRETGMTRQAAHERWASK